MFTLEQIEQAHSKVTSGADFPKYIQEIKDFGVTSFHTWVRDSHTQYFGVNEYQVQSMPKYKDLEISKVTNVKMFKTKLKEHQQGKTDYMTFCKDCAQTGVEKWIVDLKEMTCTYYNSKGDEVVIENIPTI